MQPFSSIPRWSILCIVYQFVHFSAQINIVLGRLAINHPNCAKCEMAAHLQTVTPHYHQKTEEEKNWKGVSPIYRMYVAPKRSPIFSVRCAMCQALQTCVFAYVCAARAVTLETIEEVGKTNSRQVHQLSSLQARVPICEQLRRIVRAHMGQFPQDGNFGQNVSLFWKK